MGDTQILASHRVFERVYNLTGIRTGSVRDQMLRALLLTQSLHSDKTEITDRPNGRLLVVGGGVAGVTCALVASSLNVDVTLIEKESSFFSTFAQARSRRIDPYEYDWPQPVQIPASFPKLPPYFALQYKTGAAATVARDWHIAFQYWLHNANPSSGGHVEIEKNDASLFTFPSGMNSAKDVSVMGPWNNGALSNTFGAVVICAGFGGEKTSVGAYKGPGFWTFDDGIEKPSFGFMPPNTPLKHGILISGGGDGAMQDFQRAATGVFGSELLARLEDALPGKVKLKEFAPDVLLRFALADDRAKRAYAWAPTSSNGIPSQMSDWHKQYVLGVDELIKRFADAEGFSSINAASKRLSDRLLRDEVKNGLKVVWIVKDGHPGYAYALNRFLSTLLDTLFRAWDPSLHVLRRHTTIQKIAPFDAHTCGNPATCHGRVHEVTFAPVSAPEKFEMILIRHGLESNSIKNVPHKPPISEQMSPYDIPH